MQLIQQETGDLYGELKKEQDSKTTSSGNEKEKEKTGVHQQGRQVEVEVVLITDNFIITVVPEHLLLQTLILTHLFIQHNSVGILMV